MPAPDGRAGTRRDRGEAPRRPPAAAPTPTRGRWPRGASRAPPRAGPGAGRRSATPRARFRRGPAAGRRSGPWSWRWRPVYVPRSPPPGYTRAMPSHEVVPVEKGRAWREFIDLPYRLHGGQPHFVPPLRREHRELFDRDRHPFFRHADAALFLARRAGRPVGRVEAVVNHAHN